MCKGQDRKAIISLLWNDLPLTKSSEITDIKFSLLDWRSTKYNALTKSKTE